MSDAKVYVSSVGVICSLGDSAGLVRASVSADISAVTNSNEYGSDLEAIKQALVPELALPQLEDTLNLCGLTSRQRRLLRLSAPAINQAIENYDSNEPLPIFLAGPEVLPEIKAVLSSNFIELLSIQTGIEFDRKLSRIFSTGRAGGLEIIEMAFRYFEATGKEYVLVGGVDSYLGLHVLSTLNQQNRILGEGNGDGFIPGEASGFLLLMSESAKQKLPKKPILSLSRPSFSSEVGHYYSEEPYRGDGLASAVKQLLSYNTINKISSVYTTMNGENYWAKEIGVALSRNSNAFKEEVNINHHGDCFGDIGAAFIPVLLAILTVKKTDDVSMLTASSDGPLRGAILATNNI